MRLILLTLALSATAAGAAPPATGDAEAKLAGLLQGRTAGPPQSCITRLRADDESYTIERIGEVYDVGSTRYVMRFAGGCPTLTRDAYFVTRTPTASLCAGDIAFIMLRNAPQVSLGTCPLGKFTPYTRTK